MASDEHKTTAWHERPITYGRALVGVGIYGFFDLLIAFVRAWT